MKGNIQRLKPGDSSLRCFGNELREKLICYNQKAFRHEINSGFWPIIISGIMKVLVKLNLYVSIRRRKGLMVGD